MKASITSTPVRTEKEMQSAIEELRRQCRQLVDAVTSLESKVLALTPPST